MRGEIKNVRISHAIRDDSVVQELTVLLKKHGYSVQDSSKESNTLSEAAGEHYTKAGLAPSIDWAGALLVLISPAIRTRQWVDWEIEYAERQGKRIVGVYVPGGGDADIPASFQMYGDALVGYQIDRVVEALRGTITTWCNPDGLTVVPERDIERFTCGEPTPE